MDIWEYIDASWPSPRSSTGVRVSDRIKLDLLLGQKLGATQHPLEYSSPYPTAPSPAALGAIIFDGCYVLASVPIAYGQLFAEQ